MCRLLCHRTNICNLTLLCRKIPLKHFSLRGCFYAQNSKTFFKYTVTSLAKLFNNSLSVVKLSGNIIIIVAKHKIIAILCFVLSSSFSIHFNNNIIAPIDNSNLKSILYASQIPPKHVFIINANIDTTIITFINILNSLLSVCFKILFLFCYIQSIGISTNPISLFS